MEQVHKVGGCRQPLLSPLSDGVGPWGPRHTQPWGTPGLTGPNVSLYRRGRAELWVSLKIPQFLALKFKGLTWEEVAAIGVASPQLWSQPSCGKFWNNSLESKGVGEGSVQMPFTPPQPPAPT